MEALLLAAGLGTRLQPLTTVLPKCLMPIHGRPLLGLWLEMLRQGGVDRVFINLHYLSPLVREYVLSSPYTDIVKFLDEPALLGTAGTLGHFREEFSSNELLMAHADNLTIFDVQQFYEAFETRPAPCAMTMMTFDTDDPKSCGIVTLNEEGCVIEFVEKPQDFVGTLANGAVYLMDVNEVFKILDAGEHITDFSTEILPNFVGRMNSFHNQHYHRDIGTVVAIGDAQEEIVACEMGMTLLEEVGSYWRPDKSRQELSHDFLLKLGQAGLSSRAIESLMRS
ncbi:nucleotidyltransferase family protein [Sneathiella marina]|uniref:Nucleotidyltransferase family protein n=1 Tax=Sneathiella marina TaxID=2950108 RepID=A0ABY4W0C5_9PROT|nr:nucleotidyltransferase family protein [Sneathiella marina]USG60299.1 nucleotidyltransferase family protein [Sneathiella marina]